MVDSAASAVTKANGFASAADEYSERGQYAQSIEAHFRAAEQFLLATTFTTDAESARTLRMLYANHTRKGKDLQRRHSRSSLTTTSPSPRSSDIASPGPSSNQQIAAAPIATLSLKSKAPHVDQLNSGSVVTGMKQISPGGVTATDSVKSHYQHPTNSEEQTIWRNDFEGESISEYGSRHFFVGQSSSGSGFEQQPETLASSPPKSKQHNNNNILGYDTPNSRNSPLRFGFANDSNAPATIPVESLDASIMPNKNTITAKIQSNRSPEPSGRSSANMADTLDNSYLVLEQAQTSQIPNNEEGPVADPFNKFWDVVETLVQKITTPVQAIHQQNIIPPQWNNLALNPSPASNNNGTASRAATSNPMFENLRGFKHPPKHPVMDSLASPPMPYQHRTLASASMSSTTNNMLNSYFVVPSNKPNDRNGGASYLAGTGAIGYNSAQAYPEGTEIRLDYDESRGGSLASGQSISLPRKVRSVGGGSETPLRSNKPPAIRTKTMEELLIENEQLKQTVDYLSKQVAMFEKTTEENNMLRSSIIQFRQDVQKQAKRFGLPPRQSSAERQSVSMIQRRPTQANSPATSSLIHSQLNLGATHGKQKSDDSNEISTLQRRVTTLESELKQVKDTYETQIEDLNKYKSRWLKIKEAQRKKKEAKSIATSAAGGGGVFSDESILLDHGDSLDASLTSSINSSRLVGNLNQEVLVSTPSPTRRIISFPVQSLTGNGDANIHIDSPRTISLTGHLSPTVTTPTVSNIRFASSPPNAKSDGVSQPPEINPSDALLSSQPQNSHGSKVGDTPSLTSRKSNIFVESSSNSPIDTTKYQQTGPTDMNESAVSSTSMFFSTHS